MTVMKRKAISYSGSCKINGFPVVAYWWIKINWLFPVSKFIKQTGSYTAK